MTAYLLKHKSIVLTDNTFVMLTCMHLFVNHFCIKAMFPGVGGGHTYCGLLLCKDARFDSVSITLWGGVSWRVDSVGGILQCLTPWEWVYYRV
jgi:hypothetical protein